MRSITFAINCIAAYLSIVVSTNTLIFSVITRRIFMFLLNVERLSKSPLAVGFNDNVRYSRGDCLEISK